MQTWSMVSFDQKSILCHHNGPFYSAKKSFLSKQFLLWAEPCDDVDVGTLLACGYSVYCGEELASSSNTLEALQGLTHHLKGSFFSLLSPLAAAAAAAMQIMTVREVTRIFIKAFQILNW